MATTDAVPVPRKNTAFRVTFPILDADGDLVTGATGLDSEVSKDAGTFADCTNEATEIATSSGIYYLDLTSTEMNADTVAVIVKTSSVGAKTTVLVFYPHEDGDIRADAVMVSGDATAADNLEAMLDGTGGVKLSLSQLNIVAASNDSAIVATGSGTGSGILATGGTTGHGISGVGGATSGNGIKATGTAGNSAAINAVGQGSAAGFLTTGGATGAGLSAVGGATSGAGVSATSTSGAGISAAGGTNGAGITAAGAGSGDGLAATGGATGNGVNAVGGATSGSGLRAIGSNGNANGATFTGQGSAAGMQVTGGNTGHGAVFLGGATSGNGARFAGNGSGDGASFVGTTNGDGIDASGAGSGAGMLVTGGGTGAGLKAVGGGTSGDGINASVTGASNNGMTLTGGASGVGLSTTILGTLANTIADYVIRRSFGNAKATSGPDTKTGRSLLGVVARLTNKNVVSAGTLTVYEEDDTTSLFTASVSTTAGNPITTIDP